ncbi:hypothetical protein [Microbacterium sp.]|uniref:hypothetical protein n=1 Tax=Microbacterium sp. TaxID=51671 RepID=UPI003C71EFAE
MTPTAPRNTPLASPFIARSDRLFTSKPEFYKRNVQAGSDAGAGPAVLTTPDGRTERGVLIGGLTPHPVVIPRAEAIRLATEIADAATVGA